VTNRADIVERQAPLRAISQNVSEFGSLSVRVYGVAALTAAMALLLGWFILQSSTRSEEAFSWVSHTQDVIINLNELEVNLGRAESGARGYLLTRDESYLTGFAANVAKANARAAELTRLVSDNPLQQHRAVELAKVAAEKGYVMDQAVQRRQSNPTAGLPPLQERARGKNLMTIIARQVAIMREEERRLLAVRTARAEAKVDEARSLLLFGSPVLALLIAGIAWLIRTSISRPLADLLNVVNQFRAGERQARARTTAQSAEFKRLASAYNDMADHLVAVMDQQNVRQRSIQLLSNMSHRLQALQGESELSEVLDCFMPQVLPDLSGVLYLHNHSRNMLRRIATWGNPQASPELFPPANCWALRRGQAHSVEEPGADLVCAHAVGPDPVERLCEPVLAGGEVLGLLFIEGHMTEEHRFRLDMLMENVGLALANENLRSRLREQSIRDPLTKLFNRRYMEEALALETARAERSGAPLSIVMCDVDHFKRFNDGHGHEAGDLLLAAVAGLIQAHFRQGDVVCRYGGEEFMVIAPGAPLELIDKRVEALRLAVRNLTVDHQGHRLGPVTMSFGIDCWTGGDTSKLREMVGEADRALFRAKRLGRDRVEFAWGGDVVEAAE